MAVVTEDDWVIAGNASGYGSVEVRFVPDDEGGGVWMRDSAYPSGPVLRFTRDEWLAFIDGAKDREFDIL